MRLFGAAASLSSAELAVKLSEAAQGRCKYPTCTDVSAPIAIEASLFGSLWQPVDLQGIVQVHRR